MSAGFYGRDYDDDGHVILPADDSDPLPGEPWTELGYARRLVHVYGDRLRYVSAWRRWLVWDGRRWAHDTTGQAARWAKVIARTLTTVAMAEPDADRRRALLAAARRNESAHAIAGALTLASTEPGTAISPDALDAHPFLLNCLNGVLDLRTTMLAPHDPSLLLTKLTGAAYRPDANGTVFDDFLARIMPDEDMRDYLIRLLGLALDGRQVVHILPILYGSGANGKSTLISSAVLPALGDYADAADPDLLTARSFDAHPTGTADLFGLRLAVLHESDRGRRLAEGTVKRLTGGDKIKARRMREDFWSFTPTHLFMMLTNHRPIVGGTDEGIWRRLRLVPFDVVIPPGERDEELGDKLGRELDEVLAWMVAGYQTWRKNGLDEPERVTAASAAYQAESDALARFLDERCLTGSQFYHVRSAELFAAWSQWCKAEGEEPGTQTSFSTTLANRGFDKVRQRGGYVWHGIGLTSGDEE